MKLKDIKWVILVAVIIYCVVGTFNSAKRVDEGNREYQAAFVEELNTHIVK